MTAIRTTMDRLRVALADETLYTKDPARFMAATTAFTKAEAELASAENEWLELEILRETVGQ